MDQSLRRFPGPVAGSAPGERRLLVRQKLNTPVYASFKAPQTSMVVDLSELLDLHEDGFAVQTGECLEMNRPLSLFLDLPETKSYIHSSGQVIWSDDSGRAGVRFSALTDSSRKILKEWLLTNLLIACSNHAARTEQLARREEERLADPVPVIESGAVVSIANRSETLASVEAVRRTIRALGDDIDAILQLITERAQVLTGSTGAALAFLTDDNMICRVRIGEPAPPLGAALDIAQGLSGECVRGGRLVWCENTENDPRVDPDVCRILRIGSLMAAPIVSDSCVVGVLEVFSPYPRVFVKIHGMVLDQLVGMIPKILSKNTQPQMIQSETQIQPDEVPVVARPSASKSYSIPLGFIESTSKPAMRQAPLQQKELEQKELEQKEEDTEMAGQVLLRAAGHNRKTTPTSPARLLSWALQIGRAHV